MEKIVNIENGQTKHQFFLEKKKNGKALLVEPDYLAKYPSLALLKFSSFLKKKGYDVEYVKGEKIKKGDYDVIIITTFFSTDWLQCIDTICHYAYNFPNSHISVGGIYASLFPEHIYRHTGIYPYIGCIEEVDECTPDYSLLPSSSFKETSRVFTTRGCPRVCSFCGTRLLEPELRVVRTWKKHFLPGGKYAIVHDNNILAHGDDQFSDVLDFFKREKLKFMFDNGLDCRLFNKEHAKKLMETPITEVRFSFDSLEQDGYLQNAIKYCIESGIPRSRIRVFVLYNYKDDIEEALYRAKEVQRLGVRPYAMRYQPLKWLSRKRIYISKKWDILELYDFNSYLNRYGMMKKFTYKEWKEKNKIRRAMNLPLRKWNIEKVITRGKQEAMAKDDKETIFNNSDFIISIIKGEEFIKNP